MTVELDGVTRVGGVTVAALVTRAVRCVLPRAAAFYGAKRPITLLVHRDGATMAFDIDGPELAQDEFERRFPGRRDEFEQIAMARRPQRLCR